MSRRREARLKYTIYVLLVAMVFLSGLAVFAPDRVKRNLFAASLIVAVAVIFMALVLSRMQTDSAQAEAAECRAENLALVRRFETHVVVCRAERETRALDVELRSLITQLTGGE